MKAAYFYCRASGTVQSSERSAVACCNNELLYVVCSQPVDNKLIVRFQCVAREYMSDIYRHGFGVICSVDPVRNGNAQYAGLCLWLHDWQVKFSLENAGAGSCSDTAKRPPYINN